MRTYSEFECVGKSERTQIWGVKKKSPCLGRETEGLIREFLGTTEETDVIALVANWLTSLGSAVFKSSLPENFFSMFWRWYWNVDLRLWEKPQKRRFQRIYKSTYRVVGTNPGEGVQNNMVEYFFLGGFRKVAMMAMWGKWVATEERRFTGSKFLHCGLQFFLQEAEHSFFNWEKVKRTFSRMKSCCDFESWGGVIKSLLKMVHNDFVNQMNIIPRLKG